MTYSVDDLNCAATGAGTGSGDGVAAVSRGAREVLRLLGVAVLLYWMGALASHSLADAAWSTTGLY